MKTFKSKFGYTLLWFVIVLFFGILGFMIYQEEPIEAILTTGVINFLIILFILYLNLATTYTFTSEHILNVKCGLFFNKNYDIKKFKSIRKSNNLMSSPAPSLKRLELRYGEFGILIISPENQITFTKELITRNPKIVNEVYLSES